MNKLTIDNMKMKKSILYLSFVFGCFFALISCDESKKPNGTPRGVPSIVVDTLIYETESETFSLTIHTDSTEGAKVTYFLLDGDSLLQKNEEGVFHNITPLVEGYNVQAEVVWNDTTIQTPITHINDFIVPSKPVEKISIKDLQLLINSQDHSLNVGTNEHLAQSVEITNQDGDIISMQDVLLYLSNKVWASVEIIDVTYNENNQVTNIKLTPKVISQESNYDDDWNDEF